MSNKKISALLDEAIKSPIGSTKRERAKSMVAILRRSMADGKGGPGTSTYAPSAPGGAIFLTKKASNDPNYSTMKLAETPPAPHRGNPATHAMTPAPAVPPATTPTTPDNSSLAIPPVAPTPVSFAPKTNFNPAAVPQPTNTMPNGQGGPGFDLTGMNSLPTPSSKLDLTNIGGNPNLIKPNANLSSAFSGYTLADPTTVAPVVPKTNQLTGAGAPSAPGVFSQFPTLASSPYLTKTPTPPVTATPPVVPVPTITVPGDQTGPTDGSQTDPGNTGGNPTGPSNFQSLSNTFSTKVQNAVDTGEGATAFAQNAMNDPELLKQIFPGMKELPSGSLSDAVQKLSATLKEQSGLPQMQAQLQNMIANGVTLGPMLQTYIQNKDVSLKEIDDQRKSATDAMLHTDTGNPHSAAIWGRYMDYLNTLYNSQNTSYADFYNKSIGMYNNALTALNTQTSQAVSEYENELNTDAQLTEADYNRMYQSLTDMYTSVEQAPQKEMESALMKIQLAQAQGDAAGGAFGAGQGDWVAEYKKLTDMGVLFDNTKGSEGSIQSNVTDLGGALSTILSDAPKIGMNGALYVMGQGFEKSLAGMASDPDKALPRANQFKDMILSSVQNGEIPAATGAQMAQQIGSATGHGVSSYLTSSNKTDAARTAMIYALTGQGGGWFDSGAVPTQAQFTSKFKGQLPTQLLNYIYQSAQAARNVVQQSYQQAGQSGAGATEWYGGMNPDQIFKSYADQLKGLTTPNDVGNYIGDSVSALIGGVATQALNVSS